VFCTSLTAARWRVDQYLKVENLLISIQGNVERLYNYVQQEKRNQYGPHAPNGSFTGGLSAAYSSFVQDVEMRLGEIENATAELSKHMRICPDAPTRMYPLSCLIFFSFWVIIYHRPHHYRCCRRHHWLSLSLSSVGQYVYHIIILFMWDENTFYCKFEE